MTHRHACQNVNTETHARPAFRKIGDLPSAKTQANYSKSSPARKPPTRTSNGRVSQVKRVLAGGLWKNAYCVGRSKNDVRDWQSQPNRNCRRPPKKRTPREYGLSTQAAPVKLLVLLLRKGAPPPEDDHNAHALSKRRKAARKRHQPFTTLVVPKACSLASPRALLETPVPDIPAGTADRCMRLARSLRSAARHRLHPSRPVPGAKGL